MKIDRPVGIDLGTTNSEIALFDPSERQILLYADKFGRKTVPSAVAWDEARQALLVGHAARARRGRDPGPIESIKRRMGQETTVRCGPQELSPEQVSGHILGELRACMRSFAMASAPAGVEVLIDRAVITVPAYFDAPQMEATRRAGELGGLGVLGILQEPTAAAIYHTYKMRLKDGNFLVYDLGGGTFDVSVLRCVGGEYQVLAIDGDNYLGGDDFDRLFAERLRRDLVERGYKLDLDIRQRPQDRERFERLVHLAQEIKESLSTQQVVLVSRQALLLDDDGESVTYEAEVGRADYEAVIADLVETTIACALRALERSHEVARVGLAEIDHVVLVGGSTRVPLVIRRVTEALCTPSRASQPLQDEVDTCVALGAAIHAAQRGGLRLVTDEAEVSIMSPLVASGATIPLRLYVKRAPSAAETMALLDGDRPLVRVKIPKDPDELLRLEVPVGEQPETALRWVAISSDDEVLAEMPLTFYRGDVRPRPTALSRPSVLAKDLAIEVLRGGRRERRVLVARGTGLPHESVHRLATSDQSGAVVLRILQNRLPIQTLLLEVPGDIPVGTPVELTLRCDETMRIEARATVGKQSLWARLEAAKSERLDERGAVEALLEEAELGGREMWGVQATYYRREVDLLVGSIREVIAIDPDKTHALCVRLRLLIDEFHGASDEPMSPPRHHVEGLIDSLRRVVYRAGGPLMGLDTSAWEARINELTGRADAAQAALDAGAWRRVASEAQALFETAAQDEYSSVRYDDPAYVARLLTSVGRHSERVARALDDLVLSSAAEVGALQVAERDRLRAGLAERATRPLAELDLQSATDLADTRRAIERVSAELERLEAACARIPSIGVVADRSGG